MFTNQPTVCYAWRFILAFMTMRKSTFLTACFSLLISLGAFAQSVHEYQLDNGLKILIRSDHRFPTVVSQIWYKVGSTYEHNGITGISHALEHMMFRGTQRYPSGKLIEIITEHGGIQNAFTHYDFTAYYQVLPAKQLAVSFQLEADRMQNLLLDEALFTKEMKAIQEERRLRVDDVPESLLEERFMATAYVSSPYHHPVIGWKNDLDHMTVEDLKKWYQRWYSPNNALLVIVGDIDPQKTYELAKQYFGNLPSRPLRPVKPRKEIAPLGEQSVTVNTPAKLPMIVIGYPVPSLTTAQQPKTAYALLLLSQILSGSGSSRLEKELVRQKQIATAVQTSYDFYQRQDGLFVLSGIPAQGQSVQTIKQALLKQIEKLQQQPVNPKELERIKSLIIAQKIYKKDSLQEQATEMGMLESVGLSFKQADDYVKQIESITSEDIQQATKTYLVPNKLTTGILNPLPMAPMPNTQPKADSNAHANHIPHH